MKVILFCSVAWAAFIPSVSAFVRFIPQPGVRIVGSGTELAMGYVPDGLSADQYRKLKEKEQADLKSKKLGAFGPQSFKSRSLLAFQTDLEKGKAGHLMPVFNAQEKLKRGEIKKEDIPYMQRLGSWDGTDIGKKQKGNDKDKRYNANERPANGLDWSGRGPSMGGPKSAAKKPTAAAAPKKKMGWF